MIIHQSCTPLGGDPVTTTVTDFTTTTRFKAYTRQRWITKTTTVAAGQKAAAIHLKTTSTRRLILVVGGANRGRKPTRKPTIKPTTKRAIFKPATKSSINRKLQIKPNIKHSVKFSIGRKLKVAGVLLRGKLEMEQNTSPVPLQEHRLERRHLCPICPAGVAVASSNYASNPNYDLCCPAYGSRMLTYRIRRTVTTLRRYTVTARHTRMITQTRTGVASIAQRITSSTPTIPAMQDISGMLYMDCNKDIVYSAVTDAPLANEEVVLMDAAGGELGRMFTDSAGRYNFRVPTSKLRSSSILTLESAAIPGLALTNFDVSSNGLVIGDNEEIPVPSELMPTTSTRTVVKTTRAPVIVVTSKRIVPVTSPDALFASSTTTKTANAKPPSTALISTQSATASRTAIQPLTSQTRSWTKSTVKPMTTATPVSFKVSGKLYNDTNKNGVFDAGIDIPIAWYPVAVVAPSPAARRLMARAEAVLGSNLTDAVGDFVITATAPAGQKVNVADGNDVTNVYGSLTIVDSPSSSGNATNGFTLGSLAGNTSVPPPVLSCSNYGVKLYRNLSYCEGFVLAGNSPDGTEGGCARSCCDRGIQPPYLYVYRPSRNECYWYV